MTKTENTQPEEVPPALATLRSVMDREDERKFVSGDRCSMRTVKGQPCAVHHDCDDYPDGTITSIITGEIVQRHQ
jgi:hypothetical protein